MKEAPGYKNPDISKVENVDEFSLYSRSTCALWAVLTSLGRDYLQKTTTLDKDRQIELFVRENPLIFVQPFSALTREIAYQWGEVFRNPNKFLEKNQSPKEMAAKIIKFGAYLQPLYFRAYSDLSRIDTTDIAISGNPNDFNSPDYKAIDVYNLDGLNTGISISMLSFLREPFISQHMQEDFDERAFRRDNRDWLLFLPAVDIRSILDYYGEDGLCLAQKFSRAMIDLLSLVSQAEDANLPGREADIETMRLTRMARTNILDAFLYLKTRGMTTKELLHLFKNTFVGDGLQNFLDLFQNRSIQTFTAGTLAELVTACHFMDCGYEIKLPDGKEDNLGIDLMAQGGSDPELYIQIKGLKSQSRIEVFNLNHPEEKNKLLDICNHNHSLKRRKIITTLSVLEEQARANAATPIWVLAPTDIYVLTNEPDFPYF